MHWSRDSSVAHNEDHGEAAVLLPPIDASSRAYVHLQPVQGPTLQVEQVDAWMWLWTRGKPAWSRILAGPAGLWREEPMLEQVCWQDLWTHGESALEQFLKNCSQWEASSRNMCAPSGLWPFSHGGSEQIGWPTGLCEVCFQHWDLGFYTAIYTEVFVGCDCYVVWIFTRDILVSCMQGNIVDLLLWGE